MTAEARTPRRIPEFRRNSELERLLAEVNAALAGAEKALLPDHPPRWPIVFVVGAPRSGTTLMTQWLAQSGLAAVPTNLLSRFYAAPVLGAKIQLLLTDPRYRFRDELADLAAPADFASNNGKTRGALSPNEFWYFWRRFLPDDDAGPRTDAELAATVDTRTLVAELAGMTEAFGSPLALKAMLLNFNLPFLDRLFDTALFLHVRREPLANAASILDARRRQFGSEDAWYSFKIPEYDRLAGLSPVEQVAGQVFSTERGIRAGLERIAPHKQLTVSYEDFCAAPAATWEQLRERLAAGNQLPEAAYAGPARFNKTRPAETFPPDFELAWARISRLLTE